MRPQRWQPTRLPHPWDSPGKNTGVGYNFLLQCMKVKSESEVARLYLSLSDPMDCNPPGSSIHGIFQARVLEWVPLPSLNMLSRLVITFLPRSKCLLISLLQSPPAVILEPRKIKSTTVSTVSPSICHEVMGSDAMILVFWMLSSYILNESNLSLLPISPWYQPSYHTWATLAT